MHSGGGNLGEPMVFDRFVGRNGPSCPRRIRGGRGTCKDALSAQRGVCGRCSRGQADGAAVADINLADGTYEGRGTGFGGTAALSVAVGGDRITACDIVIDSENERIGHVVQPDYCVHILVT